MEKSTLSPDRVCVYLVCLILSILGVHLAAPVLVPLLVALCLTLVLMRPINGLVSLKIPRVLAVIAVSGGILLALLITLGTIMAALPELRQLSSYLPLLLADRLQGVPALLQRAGMTLTVESLWAIFDPAQLFTLATRAVGRISGMLTGIVMVFMLVVFMLLDAPALSVKCRRLLRCPSPQWTALQQGLDSVTRYLALKTLVSLFIGLAVWGALLLLNVKFAFIWGVLALVLNFIPLVGSIIAAIPPLLLAFLFNGPATGLWLLAALLLINLVFSFLWEPVLMGRRLDLSLCTVFLSLLVWQSLLGLTGALLAVPMTLAVKLALELTPGGRGVALLMNGKD